MTFETRSTDGVRRITEAQREAIVEAMRILAEEDRERGVDPASHFACGACGGSRPLVGSVDYGGERLCNACATAFELARLRGEVRGCGEFIVVARGRR